MQKARKSYRVAMVLFTLCLAILVGLFIATNVPNPLTITDSVEEASILFETSDSIIFNDTACYTVHWRVSGIEAVYLNGNGKIGEGEERLCYDEVQIPELKVEFEDGSDKTYTLEITIVQQQSNFWIAIVIAGLLFFFSLYFIVTPALGIVLTSRRSTVYAIFNLIALTALSVLVIVGLLEVVLRFYFTHYGTENDRISYVYTSDEIQKQTSRLIGAPYLLYVTNPNYVGHNSMGYRGEEITIEKPDDTFRLISMGASTTYGFGVNASLAYPAQLQEILHEEYGYTHVEVINAGVPGYTSYEVLSNFQFRVLELDPDLILYYGAKNDADTRFEDPGCFNDPSPIYGLTTFHGLWRTEFSDLSPSVLYRYFALNTGLMNIPNSIEFALTEIPIAEECQADDDFTEEELLALNQPHFAERNFRNFLALAQFNDIDVMVSEFAHPKTLDEVDGDDNLLMSPAHVQSVAEINALYRQIAEDMDVHYYAFTDDFVIQPGMYWTNVHMRADGTKEQARLYAEYLIENDLIPPPNTD